MGGVCGQIHVILGVLKFENHGFGRSIWKTESRSFSLFSSLKDVVKPLINLLTPQIYYMWKRDSQSLSEIKHREKELLLQVSDQYGSHTAISVHSQIGLGIEDDTFKGIELMT